MKKKLLCLAAAIGFVLAVGAGPAMATTTFNLTVDNCTGGCLQGTVGTSTVVLQQNGTNDVRVTITLASPLMFVNTGLQETIDFNLTGVSGTVAATNFTNTDFSLSSQIGGNHFDGFGDFQYAIKLNTAQGAGGAQASPLSFDVTGTGLLEASFTKNASNWFFGVDVYNPTRNTTGPIGTGSNGTLSGGGNPVPEPTSVMLFGTVLAGLTTIFRKKTARS